MIFERVSIWNGALILAVLLAWATIMPGALTAQSKHDLFTVRGVKVDVTDKDAATAKLKAISQAQVEAFKTLVTRLGEQDALARLGELKPGDIGRMMASLSVESERTGPRRYIGKLTIKFLPNRVRQALSRAGVRFTEEKAGTTLLIPVWNQDDGPRLWEENPWKQAWIDLDLVNSIVPVLVPLGDTVDSEALTAEDALRGNTPRLESLKLRYSTEGMIVAIAEPVGKNAVRVIVTGPSAVGQVQFDETYTATDGDLEAAIRLAAVSFHNVLQNEWKKARVKALPDATTGQKVTMAVPFRSLPEWNEIRSRLTTVPGVTGVTVNTLAAGGAIVSVNYAVPFPQLQAGLQQRGLQLQLHTGRWTLLSN